MNLQYIDMHGHINFPDYDQDRNIVIGRARELGVGIVTVGTDLTSSRSAIALAEKYENVWAIVGQHPTDVSQTGFDYSEFKELAIHPKVVAMGECGLDYFHSKEEDMPAQREVFMEHIRLANEVGKPLMLHVRNAVGSKMRGVSEAKSMDEVPNNAYQETLQILKVHSKVPFNFHFFAGTVRDAEDIVKAGGKISFTGVITFAKDYEKLIKAVPLENIMAETDCPYVAPVPYRGKRSEPIHVIEVVKKIAEIRREDVEKVRNIITQTSRDFIKF